MDGSSSIGMAPVRVTSACTKPRLGLCGAPDVRLASAVMRSRFQTQPPPDADQRRAAKPVIVYALDALPAYDAGFYDSARTDMTKIGETLVPPREGGAL